MDTPFSFIGAADCYIDILSDTGQPTGLELQGNCSSFVPKPDAETKEQTANGRNNFGQVLASVVIPKPMTAKVTFNQIRQSLFAAAFFGTKSAFAQTAGALTDAPVVTIADRFVEIGKLKLSNVVVKNEAGTVTYILGTDYELNTNLGMIKALSTGAITAGQTVEISASHALIAGTKMEAMTKSNIRIRLKLDGQNFADGREFITNVYSMRLKPSSDFSFIGNDFVEVSFEGTLEVPAGKTAPLDHIWLS